MAQIYKKILRGEGNRGKKKASPPTPLRMERGVITVIPLVVHKCFCSSLLDYLSKPFPTASSLSRRGGAGGEVFIIFYDSTNAPHITCKASAHDVRSVSTINENGRKGDLLQTIRSRMTEKYFLISLTLSPAERGSAGNKLLINNRKTLPTK